jgi:hypothetical protein
VRCQPQADGGVEKLGDPCRIPFANVFLLETLPGFAESNAQLLLQSVECRALLIVSAHSFLNFSTRLLAAQRIKAVWREID